MKDLFTDSHNPVVSSNRILYTASSFARSSLLHLQEIGELEAKKSHTSKRDGLQSYLFFTVLSGSGALTYNSNNYPLSPGDCVFIDCNAPYSHSTDQHNLWTLRWIHFNGPAMSSVYQKYCERGGRPVFSLSDSSDIDVFSDVGENDQNAKENKDCKDYKDKMEQITSVWSSLFTTAAGADYMRDMLINQYLSELLTLIMEQSWHPENQEGHGKQSLMLVKEYLDENYASRISLDDLAERFYINKYYLSKSFKSQYGISVNNYLLNVRITKAKQMLRFSDITIDEISSLVGFSSANYLSSRFKEIEKISPKEYRERW